jgi:DNA-binding CsgD family transcriptional regulator
MMKQCDPDPDLQILPRAVREELRLTDRQMQAALGILRGETSKATARRIGCHPRTLEIYRGQLFDRLNASGANEACVIVAAVLLRYWALMLIRTAIVFGRAFP